MGHLVQLYYPEAPSGVWSITKHGTNTPATAFSDHECVTSYSNRTLTAAGRDKFWVEELVDVVVTTSANIPVDTIEGLGVSAAAVMVESASLTGTDPTNNQQVAGGRVIIPEALDRMVDSFGARDFLVRETGTTTDRRLCDVLASVRATNNRVFDVTQSPYNAVGDAVTLNDVAIQAALAASNAAGGGALYFPSGVYNISSSLAITIATRFIGDGYGVSVLRSLNATVAISVSASIQFDVERLTVAVTGAAANPITSAASSIVTFRDSRVTGPSGGNNPVNLLGSAFADNTEFTNESTVAIGSGAAGSLSCQGGINDTFRVRDCKFNGNLGTSCVYTSIRNNIISNCVFPTSGINEKIVINVNGAVGRSIVTGCDMTSQASGVTGQSLIYMFQDSPLTESDNLVNSGAGGAANIVRHNVGAPVQRITALSRCLINTGAASGTSFAPIIGLPYNLFDATANVTIGAPTLAGGGAANPWDGAEVLFHVRNTTGGAITVTLNAVYHGTATNIAAGQTRIYRFRYCAAGTPTGWIQQGAIIDVT